MRLSRYLLPTLKEIPAEAQIVSHRAMLRAGMIKQTSAGIYAWLPLGYRVLRNIERIVREEQDRFGALELLMPTIQSADLWRESGRYEDYGKEMLRIRDRHDRELLYGPTNEEMITDIFRTSIRSYKDLPQRLYHIQWKFRDEIRPRFGVMRGREFLMKDAYSFDLDLESARNSYNAFMAMYFNVFARMGLQAVPVRADTGPIGGDLSHEFHILADTGESEIFVERALLDKASGGERIEPDSDLAAFAESVTGHYAAADEMHDPATCPVPADSLVTRRGIEIGHIFLFGTKYSKAMNAVVTNREGETVPVEMGSYGVGVSRLVGAIIEASHDDAGIIWPDTVAPFDVGLVNLKPGDEACETVCDQSEVALKAAGVSVLHDDRSERPGAKFANMDLIGLPWQLVVGPRGLAAGTVELKRRATGERHEVSLDSALQMLTAHYEDLRRRHAL
ncbi:proline--tRNA ligase [Fodinicurvata sp. EGI_FJ10296]|uniref:proline--tRNA ligase n=1 Tax=Fodinicurvata sp. EGI_FJ10296 TaxID=3231908 RepID=UPI003453E116